MVAQPDMFSIAKPFKWSSSISPTQSSPSSVTLRHIELSDLMGVQRLLSHPEVIYWTAELPFPRIEQLQQSLMSNPSDQHTLIACAEGVVIGLISITRYALPRLSHTACIGPVAVHPDFQGHGIGKQLMSAALELADNWLNIHRLELRVFPDNERAIALYQKFGFSVEGCLRDIAFRAGRYTDLLVMGRVKRSSC